MILGEVYDIALSKKAENFASYCGLTPRTTIQFYSKYCIISCRSKHIRCIERIDEAQKDVADKIARLITLREEISNQISLLSDRAEQLVIVVHQMAQEYGSTI